MFFSFLIACWSAPVTNLPACPNAKLSDDGRLLLLHEAVVADNDEGVVVSSENTVEESGVVMASVGVDSAGRDS